MNIFILLSFTNVQSLIYFLKSFYIIISSMFRLQLYGYIMSVLVNTLLNHGSILEDTTRGHNRAIRASTTDI